MLGGLLVSAIIRFKTARICILCKLFIHTLNLCVSPYVCKPGLNCYQLALLCVMSGRGYVGVFTCVYIHVNTYMGGAGVYVCVLYNYARI